MATTNAIDNKSGQLVIDPNSVSDSFIQFDINLTEKWRMGVDQNASDAFKLSEDNALGTNDTFIMTTGGVRTMPLQPSFSAHLASTASNVTGNGTVYTLGTDALTEIFDQGGDFNTNGTFTASVTGRYLLEVAVKTSGLTTAADDALTQIITSNRTYTSNTYDVGAFIDASSELGFSFPVLADMDASDTATFTIMVDGEAADTVDISGSSVFWTKVAGFLVN